MPLSIYERAELLASDAKSVGLWNDEDATDFIYKIEKEEIGEDLFTIMEKEVREVLSLL